MNRLRSLKNQIGSNRIDRLQLGLNSSTQTFQEKAKKVCIATTNFSM
jgi:hypothetical protein